MTRKTLGFILIAALAASTVLTAQNGVPEGATGQMPVPPAVGTAPATPDTPPVLTEAQRAQIIIAAQQQEIWNLKLQQAQGELQKASAALQQLIASLTPPGYQLNGNLEFQKIEAPKKEPGTQ